MSLNFKLFSSWNSCFLLDEFLWGSAKTNSNLLKIAPVERKMCYLVDSEKNQHLFLEENYWRKFEKWCTANQENIEFFKRHFINFEKTSKLVKQKIDKITRVKAQLLSNEELATVMEKTREQIKEITPFDQFGMIASPIYSQKLEKIITSEKIAAATMPPWLSTTLKEELAVVKTSLEILEKEGKQISADELSSKHRDKLTALEEKFGFIPVFLFNPHWDAQYYAMEIAEKMKKGGKKLEKRKNQLENFEKNTSVQMEKATIRVESHLPEIMQILCFTRNEAELVLGYGQWKLQPFYKEICKRLRLSLNQMRHYTEIELINAIISEKADAEMLNNRIAQGVGFYSDTKSQHLLTAKEFSELLLQTGRRPGKASSQMLCAFPGKVNGKVRLVKNDKGVRNFQAGEVMVALWSCIDYLPAMKKAAAFITEGGGVTSHAAVIARELQIPCIVGYRNATKLFRDGDVVEIDAEKLVIRKK